MGKRSPGAPAPGVGFQEMNSLPLIFPSLCLLIASILLNSSSRADSAPLVLVEWNFNDPSSLNPSTGNGTLTLLGGVAATNFLGSATDSAQPNGALSLSRFPPKGQSPQTAGIELRVPTFGQRPLGIRFELRASGTASQRLRLLAAPAEGDFHEAGFYDIPQESTFARVELSLAEIPELDGANEILVRIVSDFGDSGEYVGVKPKTDSSNSYSPAGTWRIDLLAVTGEAAGTPVEPIAVQIAAGDDGVVLSWPEHPGQVCSVWRAAGPEGPWDQVASGLSTARHAEPVEEGARFFRVTSP